MKTLPIPSFYKNEHAENWNYNPDQMALFSAASGWAQLHGIKPSGADTRKVHLLLIDVQKDFCFPGGTLYVAGRSGTGAIEDSKRIGEFIYRNLETITDITTTLDTHFAFQIFFPWFWVDRDSKPLEPFREIIADEIRRGDVRPNPAVAWWLCNRNYSWLHKQVEFYCNELEKAGKYKLYLWPPHCILGSAGHALVGAIHEARLFHSFVRSSQTWAEVKGGNPLTENYSVFSPEVQMCWDHRSLGQKNVEFLKTLHESDAVIIAGQAASHCVKSSIDDLLGDILSQDPKLAKKVYIMTDCMSAVTVPDGKGGFLADFTPQAEAALQKFADAGMHLVKSVDSLASWKDFPG